MKVYLSKINGLHTNASIEQVDLDLLGDKLKYFFRLSKALSAKGNLLQCGLQNKCKAFEKIISNEICKVDAKYLEASPKFWEINYQVQEEQETFEILKTVIESISEAEYDKMQPVLATFEGAYISYTRDVNPLAEATIRKYGVAYSEVIHWWRKEVDLEAWCYCNCSYWKNSRLFFNILQKHRRMIKDVNPEEAYNQRIAEKTRKNELETLEKRKELQKNTLCERTNKWF